MCKMTTYHSKIEKKKYDKNKRIGELPLKEIEKNLENTLCAFNGDSILKSIVKQRIEAENKAYKDLIDKLGFVPVNVTIEKRPEKIEQLENGNLCFSQDLRIKFDKKEEEQKKMSDKYKILKDQNKSLSGTEVYRIQALKDFADVKEGDLGGYVYCYANLSQFGDCWVYDDAIVFQDATVLENAKVSGRAVVKGDAIIRGCTTVTDDARVMHHAIIEGCALVCSRGAVSGSAVVTESATVTGDALVTFKSQVKGNAYIREHSEVRGYAVVKGSTSVRNSYVAECATIDGEAIVRNSSVYGCAVIDGEVEIENADIVGDAVVKEAKDYLVMQNNWNSDRFFTFTRSNRQFKVGCFYGCGKELIEKAFKDSEEKGEFYKNAVNYVNSVYNLHEELENIEKFKPW